MNSRFLYFVSFIAGLLGSIVVAEPTNALKSNKLPESPGSYRIGTNGEFYSETNIGELWPGTWKEGINGLRVQLYLWDTNLPKPKASVAVGSVITNSGGGNYDPPDGKFEKFELRDSNGIIVPLIKGASMDGQHPARISVDMMPRWHSNGGFRNLVGFLSNGPPAILKVFSIADIYRIEKEGDYKLTVCPLVYKFETNGRYLDRLDLPCVSATIHLAPPQKQ